MQTASEVLGFIDERLIQTHQSAGPLCVRAVLDPDDTDTSRAAFQAAASLEALRDLRNAVAARIDACEIVRTLNRGSSGGSAAGNTEAQRTPSPRPPSQRTKTRKR